MRSLSAALGQSGREGDNGVFLLAMGLNKEVEGWWRRHLIQPLFTAAQKVT
jgi:hypothetical protein